MSNNITVANILKQSHSEIGTQQKEDFVQGFLTIEKQLNNTADEQLNDESFIEKLIDSFDKLLVGLGFDEYDPEQAEQLMLDLYENGHEFLISFVAMGYRQICHETDLLCGIGRAMAQDNPQYIDEYGEPHIV